MSRAVRHLAGPARAPRPNRAVLAILLAAGILAAGAVPSCRKSPPSKGNAPAGTLERVEIQPVGIMGTDCELTIVMPTGRAEEGQAALAAAADALRDVEAMMSDRLPHSALGRLNAAPAGRTVALPPELREVIDRASAIGRQTDGAFDVTCRPLIALWRDAAKTGRPPSEEQIDRAKALVGIGHFQPAEEGFAKDVAGATIDLGAIAKGYAVDRATAPLEKAPGAVGAMVNAGGDLRCFGVNPDGQPWRIGIRHPFKPPKTLCGVLLLSDGAVATSGDYERSVEIAGTRYNHIIDPRIGRPATGTHSVTVVSLGAPGRTASAADADAWATALSVLGPDGLLRLADLPGMEAMIISGTPDAPTIRMTDGFAELLDGPIELN